MPSIGKNFPSIIGVIFDLFESMLFYLLRSWVPIHLLSILLPFFMI